MKEENKRREPCCDMGTCPSCSCCICICTKELKKILSPEARELLIKELS